MPGRGIACGRAIRAARAATAALRGPARRDDRRHTVMAAAAAPALRPLAYFLRKSASSSSRGSASRVGASPKSAPS